MLLKLILMRMFDENVRKEAVKKISDESVLADVAKNAPDRDVRKEAVKKIDNNSILADVAKTDSDEGIRIEAVRRIGGGSALVDVAKNALDRDVRREAVKKIDEMSVLADVAKNDSDEDVRLLAVGKIDEMSVLVDVAKNAPDEDVRCKAVSKISDESVLIDIAKNDSDEDVRCKAVSKISDESVLIDIVKNDSAVNVRCTAIPKINDESILLEFINDTSDEVRKVAFRRYKSKYSYKLIDNSPNFYNDELKEFESLNATTLSIYNLEDYDVLIILKDGTNLTDWDDVTSKKDIMYISEDLSNESDLKEKYFDYYISSYVDYENYYFEDENRRPCNAHISHGNQFGNVKAIVAQRVSKKASNLNGMFKYCSSLTTVSGLDTWDVSNVRDISDLFAMSSNLKIANGFDNINLSNISKRNNIFGGGKIALPSNVRSDVAGTAVRGKVDHYSINPSEVIVVEPNSHSIANEVKN